MLNENASEENFPYTTVFQILNNGLSDTHRQIGKLEKTLDLLENIYGPHFIEMIKENISEEEAEDFCKKIKKIKEVIKNLEEGFGTSSPKKPP